MCARFSLCFALWFTIFQFDARACYRIVHGLKCWNEETILCHFGSLSSFDKLLSVLMLTIEPDSISSEVACDSSECISRESVMSVAHMIAEIWFYLLRVICSGQCHTKTPWHMNDWRRRCTCCDMNVYTYSVLQWPIDSQVRSTRNNSNNKSIRWQKYFSSNHIVDCVLLAVPICDSHSILPSPPLAGARLRWDVEQFYRLAQTPGQ